MRVIIIDNEENLRKSLRFQLLQHCSGSIEIDEAEGVVSGREKIINFKPDIVFLDIELEDGTGFDLLATIKYPAFQLIFTTAYHHYAIRAFKFSAIDYLLKPIDTEALQESFERAAKNIHCSEIGKQLSILNQQLYEKPSKERKIVLNDKQFTYFIKIEDIIFCKAEGVYTKFYLNNHHPVLISKNLKEYEELLAPFGFIRTHNSYIVNPARIIKYDKMNNEAFIVEGGHKILVSQRKKEYVLKVLHLQ